jgi:hypothetical protein
MASCETLKTIQTMRLVSCYYFETLLMLIVILWIIRWLFADCSA